MIRALSSGGAAARPVVARPGALTDAEWRARHRWVVGVLAAFLPVITLYGAIRDAGDGARLLLAAGVPAVGAAASSIPFVGRSTRTGIAAVGVMACSAVVVQLTHGAIEAHVLFVVMIPVIALYDDWVPFVPALLTVVVADVAVAELARHGALDAAGASARAWDRTALDAGVTLAAAVICLVGRRLREIAHRAQRDLAAQWRRRWLVDPLTGLPTREWIIEEGWRTLSGGDEVSRLSVLVLEINLFREVNDALGREVGDDLLRQVARRLDAVVAPQDRTLRLGPDVFAVLLVGRRADIAPTVAAELARRLGVDRLGLAGVELDLEVTIGIAVEDPVPSSDGEGTADPGARVDDRVEVDDRARADDRGADDRGADDRAPAARLSRLLRRAESAMHVAKRDRLDIGVYDPRDDRRVVERLALLTDLREALWTDQLRLAFQPKISLRDGSLVGAEALLRWTHPVRGSVPPMEFIPTAESSNLMSPLTYRVLSLALGYAQRWYAAGTPVRVSVNVPPRTLIDEDFVSVVHDALASGSVPGSLLCLELTETTFMDDPVRTLEVIAELRAIGVELSIDDFGTGYSSLSYLRDLPVGEIKIDKSFVQRLLERREDAILIEATIDLAHRLGMTVVAEGVEDEASGTALARMGCDVAQGYHYSRPLMADEFELWLGGVPRA